LVTINYSSITTAARRDAEIFYLSQVAQEISARPSEEEPLIISRHRRWQDLCKIHGEPAIRRAASDSAPIVDILGSRFVLLQCFDHRTMSSGTRTNSHEQPVMELRMPMSWSIYRIYGWVADKFDTSPLHIRLVWETDELDPATKSIALAGEDSDPYHVPAQDDKDDVSGKWVQREVALEPGPRELGFWIESNSARVRVEKADFAFADLTALAQVYLLPKTTQTTAIGQAR